MTDHIAFLIDCLRKGCIFLLEKELHTATKYQVIHLHDRVRGRGSLFSGHYYPMYRDNWVSHALGIPTAPCIIVTWCGLGCGGRGRSGGYLGNLMSCQSRLMVHCGLSFCAGIYAPLTPPRPLTPFQNWILLGVEMAIPSWA